MQTTIPQSKWARFVFGDTRLAWLWLIVRLYVGWEWLKAGWEKVGEPAWTGPAAGTAVKGFLTGALAKTGGEHPAVSAWYAYFIERVALPNATIFSYLVAYGEVAVGIALILGFLVGISSFFGVVLNLDFLLAGTTSINPQLLVLEILLILAWRTAGWLGLDRWILPRFRKSL